MTTRRPGSRLTVNVDSLSLLGDMIMTIRRVTDGEPTVSRVYKLTREEAEAACVALLDAGFGSARFVHVQMEHARKARIRALAELAPPEVRERIEREGLARLRLRMTDDGRMQLVSESGAVLVEEPRL